MKLVTRLLLTAKATAEALDLEDAKAQLRVMHSSDDYFISKLITSVRRAFEIAHEHTLMPTGWQLTLNCFPVRIDLRSPPIISITSIKYTDVDGAEQTVDPADYTLVIASPVEAYVTLAVGKSWPSTYPADNAVRVVYQAGYATAADVPEEAITWMKDLLTYKYNNRGDEPGGDDRLKPNFLTAALDTSSKL